MNTLNRYEAARGAYEIMTDRYADLGALATHFEVVAGEEHVTVSRKPYIDVREITASGQDADRPAADPWHYQVTREKPGRGTRYVMHNITRRSDTASLIKSYQLWPNEGSPTPGSAEMSWDTESREMVETYDALKHGIPNTSEHASLLPLTHIVGEEAKKFQGLFEKIYEDAAIDPATHDYRLIGKPGLTVDGHELEAVAVNPRNTGEAHMPGNSLMSLAPIAGVAGDLVVASVARYGSDQELLDLSIHFSDAVGHKAILTPEERNLTYNALELQMTPNNFGYLREY